MTYPEAIKYLESFINYETIPTYAYRESLKLERVKDFLLTIGNPHNYLRCIHVAGTKGKGSTCAFITYILRQAGYKVGLYTSPHLLDFRERIRVLDSRPASGHSKNEFEGMIEETELIELIERLKPAIKEYNKKPNNGALSFFEVYTSLAFVYFRQKKVDFAVLETGLGGRLDATNVACPLVCAITPISYEHTQKLGDTLNEIATEKAGIIKNRNLFVVTAPQEEEALQVIRKKCRETRARLFEVGRDIFYEKKRNTFVVKGLFGEYQNLMTDLIGQHQLINATVAVGVIESLRYKNNISIGADYIRQGIRNTAWPGRCEILSYKPLVVLDGAQNVASARCLKETIKENFRYDRLILVLGISGDKDIKGICSQIHDLADDIVLTKSDSPRAAETDLIEKELKSQMSVNHRAITKTKNVKEALKLAVQKADDSDLVLFTGSLFVVGEAKELFKRING